MPNIINILELYLLAVNVVAFVLFGIDKRRARADRWRIPERTLFLSAILGGSVGAILGMRIFHHKTRHKRFFIGLPFILALQIALAVFLFRRYGPAS